MQDVLVRDALASADATEKDLAQPVNAHQPEGSLPGSSQFGHSHSDQSTNRSPTRILYLDNLRGTAMLLGVLLHAGLAYAQPAQSIWLATDRQSSRAIDCGIWFIHLFRMALFFLIAGYFGKLMLSRKNTQQFLANRVLRIAGPFVLFWPVLYFSMGAAIVFGVVYIKQPEGIMKLIQQAANNPDAANLANTPTTMHLWFLYYLMMFSLLAIGLRHPLRWIPWDRLFRARYLLLVGPILLVPAAMAGGSPLAAPESFMPTWWPVLFYGLYYLVGWQLYGRESTLDRVQPWIIPMALISGLAYVGYYRLMPQLDIVNFSPLSGPGLIVEAMLTAYLSAWLVALSLIAGRRFLSTKSTLLRWVADASYWTYLMHLPIVIFLQLLLVETELNVWLKFSIVVSATLLACGTTYVVFVRYTPVGWLLNGKRTFP